MVPLNLLNVKIENLAYGNLINIVWNGKEDILFKDLCRDIIVTVYIIENIFQSFSTCSLHQAVRPQVLVAYCDCWELKHDKINGCE